MATKALLPLPTTAFRHTTHLHLHHPKTHHTTLHLLLPPSSHPFTTTPLPPPIAAPPIDFTTLPPPTPHHPRLVPASPSYFTGKPDFTDNLLTLQRLLRSYQTLPTLPAASAPRSAWRRLPEYRIAISEPVKASRYQRIILLLQRLNRIHPALMPAPVATALDSHRRDINPYANRPRPQVVDADGRAYGAGRRKTSSARAYLVRGEGEVLVNGKSVNEVFGRIHDRESALWALKCSQRLGRYNVWALVGGGGTTGQAESLTLAVAKALLVHEPALKPVLRRAGCVTRDPRRVERKKPGKLKARKMPAWVKR